MAPKPLESQAGGADKIRGASSCTNKYVGSRRGVTVAKEGRVALLSVSAKGNNSHTSDR